MELEKLTGVEPIKRLLGGAVLLVKKLELLKGKDILIRIMYCGEDDSGEPQLKTQISYNTNADGPLDIYWQTYDISFNVLLLYDTYLTEYGTNGIFIDIGDSPVVSHYDDEPLRELINTHDHDDRYAKVDHTHPEYVAHDYVSAELANKADVNHTHTEYLEPKDLEGYAKKEELESLGGGDVPQEITDKLDELEAMVLFSRKVIPNNAYSEIPLTEYDFTGVEHIGRHAFSKSSLTGDLVLPDTLLSLGTYGFSNSQLTSVSFQGELTEIPSMAFMRNSITSIEFPEGLKVIGFSAFEYNPLEGELRIPETVERIGENAFIGTQLSTVYVPEKTQYATGLLEGSFPSTAEIIRY